MSKINQQEDDYLLNCNLPEDVMLELREASKRRVLDIDEKQITRGLGDMTTRIPGKLVLEDVLDKKSKFITTIKSFGIISYSAEDLFGEFILKCVVPSKRDGLTYLERWDAKSCTPMTWLYGTLRNLLISVKTRENSEGGFKITTAKALASSYDKEDENGLNTINVNTLLVDTREDRDSKILVDQIMQIVEQKYSTYHSTSSTGVQRSPFVVLQYMREGYTRAEIAEIMETSLTFIASLISKIMKDEQIIALRREYLMA